MNFQQWMKRVDQHVAAKIGLTTGDMPDLCFVHDWFDDGMSPQEAARELLETWAEEGDLPAEFLE